MNIFISADIEGVTGLSTWSQCGGVEAGSEYQWARQMMAGDVNAAIRGARRAGATRIVVKDSHGNSKNLIARDLEPNVELISGVGSGGTDGMMQGIDVAFDLAFLVGYHARAGTHRGIMCHTITGRVHRLWINDLEIGEIGISSAIAGVFNVPIALVVSDLAGCNEASELLKNVETVSVKEGLGRHMGRMMHPHQTSALIEAGAERAVQRSKEFEPWSIPAPYTLKIEFNRDEECDYAERYPGTKRLDSYTIQCQFATYAETHQALRNLLVFGDLGSHSNA
jgi:D-amino peptidase